MAPEGIQTILNFLSITVGNLQLKVDTLTSTNISLKAELDNVHRDLHLSQEENKKLLEQIGKSSFVSEPDGSQETSYKVGKHYLKFIDNQHKRKKIFAQDLASKVEVVFQ